MENKKEKLFVYGTLIHPEIQQKIIGRVVKTEPGVLGDYKKSTIKINDNIYPIIVPDENSVVGGLVLAVSSSELRNIDEYETNAYRRTKVILKSGKEAWVYCK